MTSIMDRLFTPNKTSNSSSSLNNSKGFTNTSSINTVQGLFGEKDGVGGGGLGYAKAGAKGAAVGSILGPIGTAVGAGIGMLVHKVQNNKERANKANNVSSEITSDPYTGVSSSQEQQLANKASNNTNDELYNRMKARGWSDETIRAAYGLMGKNWQGETRQQAANRIASGGSSVINMPENYSNFGQLVNIQGLGGYGL